jgi:hypothetical protein
MSVSQSNRERPVVSADVSEASGGNGKDHGKDHAADQSAEAKTSGALGRSDRHVNRLNDKTDEDLLSAYRLGDRTSFATLVERYQRELFHFLVRFLGDRAAAEDIFQEAFLQVHQSADQFDPQRRFRPWLFTIAANKARDLMSSY